MTNDLKEFLEEFLKDNAPSCDCNSCKRREKAKAIIQAQDEAIESCDKVMKIGLSKVVGNRISEIIKGE